MSILLWDNGYTHEQASTAPLSLYQGHGMQVWRDAPDACGRLASFNIERQGSGALLLQVVRIL